MGQSQGKGNDIESLLTLEVNEGRRYCTCDRNDA